MPAVGSRIDSDQEEAFEKIFAILLSGMQTGNMSLHGFASTDGAYEFSLHTRASRSFLAAAAIWVTKDSTSVGPHVKVKEFEQRPVG